MLAGALTIEDILQGQVPGDSQWDKPLNIPQLAATLDAFEESERSLHGGKLLLAQAIFRYGPISQADRP